MNNSTPSKQQLIDTLDLEAHVEGGYFRQTFKSDQQNAVDTPYGPRTALTSIYYLLTDDASKGHFHLNRSDIMHYFHCGDPITYYLIHPDGALETRVLGGDILAGQELQFVVPGGVWKASRIHAGAEHGYGLIGEAVAPGFEYEDMTLGKAEDLIALFPQHRNTIIEMTR